MAGSRGSPKTPDARRAAHAGRKRQRMMLLRSILTILLLSLAGWWTLLYFNQRSMMFPAPSPAGGPPRPADAQQVWLALPEGPVEAWYLPPLAHSARPAPVLLFTHGNGELIDYWPAEFDLPRRWGFGVLLLEYPGYGRSRGKPSEVSITAAVTAAYDWAVQQPDIDAQRIVAWGRSVGSGAACALLAQRPIAAAILESPFTSVAAFARQFGAPGFLVRDRFDNLARVQAYRGPLLILHGADDMQIPPAHSQALAAAAPKAELHLLPCGHNDCPRPWEHVERFLRGNGLKPPL